MNSDARRPDTSVRSELKVALGLSAAWLAGSLMLFVLLPGGSQQSSFTSAANDMWGVRIPDLSNPIPLDAGIPGAPHEHHEDDDDQHSYALSYPNFAEGPETLVASRLSGATASHTGGRPAFSSDGTFLGTVCCVEKRTADGFGLQLTKGSRRYSLSIPEDRVDVRGSAIQIGMSLQDVNRAAGAAAPHC
ncbi:hypothetical protein ACO2I3_17725 [Leptospira interrogans]